jgi:hypothetical protein
VQDWLCILSPWLAFVGLIIWDTCEKGFRSPFGIFRDADPNRIVALGTLLLALGTFALAWVAYNTDKATHSLAETAVKQAEATETQAVVMKGQLEAMGRQLALMEADQRPWLYAAGSGPDSPLHFDGTGAHLRIQFQLKNVGRSPAHFVTVNGAFFIRNVGSGDFKRGWQQCDELRSVPIDKLTSGTTIFPGDIRPIIKWFNLDAADALRMGTDVVHSAPMIGGCVDYVFGGSEQHHQTRFMFEVDKTGPNGSLSAISSSDGDVAVDDIRFALNPALSDDAD